jgi:hypothetical protein
MPTFEDPSNNMEEAFGNVRDLDCHRERLGAVKIAVFSAHASRDEDDEPRGEALARRGRPILGMIRISSLEDRAEGMADVRVILNGDRWGQLSGPMQRAVIDTCLTQIEVRQKDGAPMVDDLGRPKLQQRPWDFELYGFHEVAVRHGSHSVEVHNFRVLFDEHGQTYLPHFAPDDRPVNYLAVAPKRTHTRAKEIATGASSDVAHQRGPLASSALIARIEHLRSAATLLAVGKLELQKKPRDPVVKAIKGRVLEMTILPDYIRITKGEDQHDPPVELDLDAAVLVTSPSDLDLDTLDRLVPGCRDVVVLDWVLDDERGREEPRPEVVEVIEARLQELGAAITPKQIEPRSGALGDKELRGRISSLTCVETLLGIYILEVQRKKPRRRVVDALCERATDLGAVKLLSDMKVVDDGGHEFTTLPDLAAGVLATSDDQVATKTVEFFVPSCRDLVVLGWLIDGDQAPTDDLAILVKGRIAQLVPAQPSATMH